METFGTREGSDEPALEEGEVVAEWNFQIGRPVLRAFGSGLIGAAALTLAHETARMLSPKAPRLDRIGKRGVLRLAGASDVKPPRGKGLYATALAGDLLLNGLVYGSLLLGTARRPYLRGVLGGLLMGTSALVLPQRLGLGRMPKRHRSSMQAMTFGWYLLGGLAAGGAYAALLTRAAENW